MFPLVKAYWTVEVFMSVSFACVLLVSRLWIDFTVAVKLTPSNPKMNAFERGFLKK